MIHDVEKILSEEMALRISRAWLPQKNPFGAAWQDLVSEGRSVEASDDSGFSPGAKDGKGHVPRVCGGPQDCG